MLDSLLSRYKHAAPNQLSDQAFGHAANVPCITHRAIRCAARATFLRTEVGGLEIGHAIVPVPDISTVLHSADSDLVLDELVLSIKELQEAERRERRAGVSTS